MTGASYSPLPLGEGQGEGGEGEAVQLTHRYLWGQAGDQLLADEQLSPLSRAESGTMGEAIDGIWTYTDGLIYCQKYSSLILIKGYIDLAEEAYDNCHQSGFLVLDKLDRLFYRKVIPEDLPDEGCWRRGQQRLLHR